MPIHQSLTRVKLKPNNAVKVSTEDCTNVYPFIKEPYDPVPAQNTGEHPLFITITEVSAVSPTQLVPSSTDNTNGSFTATPDIVLAIRELTLEIRENNRLQKKRQRTTLACRNPRVMNLTTMIFVSSA
ncbi:hypothetical protein BDEG_28391 [Batrachochytrium dendrobatidis JEL423]|uniref:Uncharacterized protein n=1 Tax=Batrachochytrium dendrobatidis (strain JEL423) TaxID=403673 RepID=A0A177WZ95_BATDL|nr:hypothetical protein BDEG_28391 [Batrachochytrium dendrobatidis JEL423]